jgi:FkbM family methyltransferase
MTITRAIRYIKNWPVFLADRLSFLSSQQVYYLRNGLTFSAKAKNAEWWNMFLEIFVEQRYNPQGFGIAKGDVVVDIGAHEGMFALYAAKRGAEVFTFEPVCDLQNVKQFENIHAFVMAVAGKTGQVELFLESDGLAHSMYGKGSSVTVPTISLEDIMRQNNLAKIDFLKMNCEGAEYDILLNCPREILQNIKKISMECHDFGEGKNAAALKVFLEQHYFSVEIKNIKGFMYLFALK